MTRASCIFDPSAARIKGAQPEGHPREKRGFCVEEEESRMPEIMTVLGPIAPEEFGFTSMHEHILTNVRIYRDLFEP